MTTALLDDLLVKTSRTFALSIPALPEPTRCEVTVAYLLFRTADTLEDATTWSPARQRAELGLLADLVREPSMQQARSLGNRWIADPPLAHEGYLELLSHLPSVIEAWLGLSRPARELICRHTLRTIEQMASFVGRGDDQRRLELRDIADLQAYCYAVAGIVGEMLTELFLLGREHLTPVAPLLRRSAARFGEALQLVNILKDSSDDAREGRRYLPSALARSEVFTLARSDLEAAATYVRALQQSGAPRGIVAFTALPVLLARATLDRVEREGPSSKLTRLEVQELVGRLDRALDRGEPAVTSS